MDKIPFGQTARSRKGRAYGPGFEVGDEIGCFVDSTTSTLGDLLLSAMTHEFNPPPLPFPPALFSTLDPSCITLDA